MTTSIQIRQERLQKARLLMKQHHIDALIIPSNDPHMSEYLPNHWQGRSWLSGFTGSVGTLVITNDFAGVWTDNRYWVQAPIQLAGTGIELKKIQKGEVAFGQFLAQHLPNNATVAIDGAVLSVGEQEILMQAFLQKNIRLKTDMDLLSQIWQDRPSLPNRPIYQHPDDFIDVSATQKLAQVRTAMQAHHADFHLICSLDDIAWLTNLRGSDVEFNPVFLSHLLITKDDATLFVDDTKLDDKIRQYLKLAGIAVADYHAVVDALATISTNLLIDPNKVAIGTLAKLSPQVTLIKKTNPSTLLKAIKTDKEIHHIREAMRQDGAALCEFFARFEQLIQKQHLISELDVAQMLTEARSRQPNYVSASFDTIAGFNANGAIVHYKATEDNYSQLLGDGLLLIDSGAQYYNGTTDITRMAGIGHISQEQKQDVTYVLKAHIALSCAHFPINCPSSSLDVLARNQLWQQGLDYGHGTGHGVGYFMNVHEGPQVIAITAPATPDRVMKKGMITTNEPGLYREGKWGIRLENCLVNVPAFNGEFGEFLKFDELTLCPFDTRLILPELLTAQEKDWLNAYHQRVHDELIDRVDGDAKTWLIERTCAI